MWNNKGDGWHPWLQWKNAFELDELDNPGASRMDDKSEQGPIVESTNLVGTFAKTLDLRAFPFDVQELTLILVSNSTKDAVLSYMNPQAIKSNFEYEVLSEWIVVRDPENGQALSWFSFEGADPRLSAQGAAYNNFVFNILVARNAWATTLSTVIPSSLLAMACLCSFSLNIDQGPSNRFSVVFTVILTLVANQIVTKERLPILPYNTFIDYFLLSMTLTCYAIGVEAVYVSVYTTYYSLPGHEQSDAYYFDIRGFWICFGLLFGTFLGFILRGQMLIRYRKSLERKALKNSKDCRIPYKKP